MTPSSPPGLMGGDSAERGPLSYSMWTRLGIEGGTRVKGRKRCALLRLGYINMARREIGNRLFIIIIIIIIIINNNNTTAPPSPFTHPLTPSRPPLPRLSAALTAILPTLTPR
jgi:hypothetical protein